MAIVGLTINRSIDVEEQIRSLLTPYMTAYCRPLPADYSLPCVLVQAVGGDSEQNYLGVGKVDTFTVVLDARAETEAEAFELIRNAVGAIEQAPMLPGYGISYAAVNSLYSWGSDPVRPDLSMCSATMTVTAHREETILPIKI